jgi:hypothetical protein
MPSESELTRRTRRAALVVLPTLALAFLLSKVLDNLVPMLVGIAIVMIYAVVVEWRYYRSD